MYPVRGVDAIESAGGAEPQLPVPGLDGGRQRPNFCSTAHDTVERTERLTAHRV
jgi:hypothetical protein